MRTPASHWRRLALMALLVAPFTAGTAQADSLSRTGRWEFTLAPHYLDAKTIQFDGGAKVETDGSTGFGFGFGHHFNPHWALTFDVGWNNVDYQATFVNADGSGASTQRSGELEMQTVQLNLRYNFLKGPLTPFVQAGVGTSYIDTNIPTGPAGYSCWYDPWYGYTCYGYQPTQSSYNTSYNGGLGAHWDFSSSMFLRGVLGKQWIEMSHTSSTPSLTVLRLDLGFKF